MAKKLEQSRKTKKDEPVQVASLKNLTGLDAPQLVQDVKDVSKLVEDLKEAGTPVSDHKKLLKSERGYHMGAFAQCMKLARMDPVEAKDFWLTLSTFAEEIGVTQPDLVEAMEAV
ncbi:hypothetical protein [uncultured Hyphomicrobium sp.]|uniref:hypothetical protein n=1 Tax=uncultured Hyphomicrobium sp. TaxID=194373 RepID=UPI0025F79959|nr:hypothetical protein [uncultured Hyphomicrobium sp.]